MTTFFTPLRYPGGKARLGPWIADVLRHNSISGGIYVEPYAGGAGAAIYLLLKGYVDHIVINDADPVVAAFWWAITQDTERFLQMLDAVPVTMDEWHQQRAVHHNLAHHDATQIGFATFFLNRTNRSGILAGGVIGGLNQTGPYKVDARFNKKDLRDRISRIASMRRHISVYGLDALELLGSVCADLSERSLIYLDPPYYEKGSQLYRNFYVPDDHMAIAAAVSNLRTPWIVSYDNCPEIRALYAEQNGTEFSLKYTTHTARPIATEALFFGGGIHLHAPPELRRTQNPSRRTQATGSAGSPAHSNETRNLIPECI